MPRGQSVYAARAFLQACDTRTKACTTLKFDDNVSRILLHQLKHIKIANFSVFDAQSPLKYYKRILFHDL